MENEEEILTEITDFCETCPKHESCPEDECILFRIEQLLLKREEDQEGV